MNWQRIRWAVAARGAARTAMIREAVLIEVDGRVGEAAPLPGVSRETVDDVIASLETGSARPPSLQLALEASTSTCTCTSTAVVVDTLDEAREAIAAGAPVLKLKAAQFDLDRVRAFAALGVPLRLDANQAWSDAEARVNLAALRGLPIEYVEEPTRDSRALLDLGPIALDESLLDDEAIDPRLAAVVLKPTVLGPERCRRIAAAATRAGVGVVVTHALEGPIGTAACTRLAAELGTRVPGLAPHAALAGWRDAPMRTLEEAVDAAPVFVGGRVITDDLDLDLDLNLNPTLDVDLDPTGPRSSVDDKVKGGVQVQVQVEVDVLSVVATPTRATLEAIYAALAAGAPIALHHHRLADGELERQRAQLVDLPPRTRVVLFTSGSTRAARGVAHTARSLLAACEANALGWRADDRWLLALSMAHAGGLAVAVRCLVARVPVVLLEGDFDAARVARMIERHRVTLASLVPAQLAALLDDPAWRPPAHLRAVLLGGAAASPALLAAAAARGVPFYSSYGMTETFGQIATAARPGDPDAPLVALPGVELAGGTADAPAPLRVRGPMLATTYLGGPAIAPELITSDLGYVDEAVHLLGRADDVIITGGENVHPLSVEAVVAETPGVRAACAFGVADARWGQVVAIAISVDAPFDLSAALARWRAALPAHARPRRIAFAEALPLLPSGKPDRRATAALSTDPVRYDSRE